VGAIRRVDAAAKGGGGGVKNLGGFVTQAGFQVTDFAVQVQGGTNAITAFSQQFPQLIGSVQQSGLELGKIKGGLASLPIDIGTAISLGAVAIGIGSKLAVDAYDAMRKAQDELTAAQKRGVEQLIFQQVQQQALVNQERVDFIEQHYARQNAELEKKIRNLERIAELTGAQNTTAAAQAAAAVAAAQATGGNVAAAQGNALAVGVQGQVNAVQGELAKAEAAAAKAAEDLAKANTLLGEFRSRNDQFSDEFKKADANFVKATDANVNAQADLDLQRQKYELALQAIEAANDGNLASFKAGVDQAQTRAAQETLATMEAKVAELGGNVSSNFQQALNDLRTALLDGVVKANESPLVADAINQLRASREGADQRILAALGTLLQSTENVNRTLPALENRINAVEAAARAFAGSARN
jgi:hypothetical protein